MTRLDAWANSAALLDAIAEWPSDKIDSTVSARHLSRIMAGSLLNVNVESQPNLLAQIRPSAHAKMIFSLDERLSEAPQVYLRIASLISLYHHDLMIDIDTLDVQLLETEISNLVNNKELVLAPRFGRTLYDIFSQNFKAQRQDFLDATESSKLLNGVAQGVYQVGPYVTGNFGIIKSQEWRIAPPTTSVPLWHCDDVGCNQLHDVRLSDENAKLHDIINRVESVAATYLGPASHWRTVLNLIEQDNYPTNYSDLFVTLQDCFGEKEIKAIFLHMLSEGKEKSKCWNTLENCIGKKRARSNPNDVVLSLSHEDVLQLIFCSSDSDIINSVDYSISSKNITVPPSEVRRTRQSQPTMTNTPSNCSISSLGIRSDASAPPAEMAIEVWSAHQRADRLTDLSWKAIKGAGPATPGVVLSHLNHHSPRETIEALVISTREVAQDICESVELNPILIDTDQNIVDKLAWKLGFDVPRFGVGSSNLRRHLAEFKDVLLTMEEPTSQAERERIRSAGVNLFVELEWFIEHLISYNTWLLHNDHFLTKFVYNPDRAVSVVDDILPRVEESFWKKTGGNMLGSLLAYLAGSVAWMDSLRSASSQPRPEGEYPHYADRNSELFPFHNKNFWADCDPVEFEKYAKSYKDVANSLLRSGLAAVRNGLDHYRKPDEFPSLETMIACESRVSQALDIAEHKRISPIQWWPSSELTSDSGLSTISFYSMIGSKFEANYPSAFTGIRKPGLGELSVIPFGNLLGQPNSTIAFKLQEDSSYEAMWSNYPARNAPDGLDDLATGQAALGVDNST